MTYYFLSSRPTLLEDFQKRIPALGETVAIKGQEDLEKALEVPSKDAFFFASLGDISPEVEKWILMIREVAPLAKIIYLTDDKNAHDLKLHQKQNIGGDAYIHQGTRPMDLADILESLKLPEVPTESEVQELPSEPPLLAQEETEQKIENTAGENMSTNDKNLNLDASEDLEIDIGGEELESAPVEDAGLELSLDEESSLDLGEMEESAQEVESDFGEVSLGEEEELSLGEESLEQLEELEELGELGDLGELSLDSSDELLSSDISDEGLSLDESLSLDEGLALDEGLLDEELADVSELHLGDSEDDGLGLALSEDDLVLGGEVDLSEDAKEKLKEIDAIMVDDATQAALKKSELEAEDLGDAPLDEPLVSDDLNLDSLNFGSEDEPVEEIVTQPVESKKKKKEAKESRERDLGQDLKEISGAYSGEMERLQATLSNLRTDREELLAKISKLEEEKVLQNRQTLTLRAELDEKKIELTIIRKKLNEELNEMKDKFKLFDEKRLILEEKNKLLTQELDKTAQKNKIDVKKVQMRERELEQKLELLKTDAQMQIKNRDLKILELKRKIDAMEFDMESISQQEKRSVESRFELEDKLDKAIKTLRNAITVLEDETDRNNALSALKKNIDM